MMSEQKKGNVKELSQILSKSCEHRVSEENNQMYRCHLNRNGMETVGM